MIRFSFLLLLFVNFQAFSTKLPVWYDGTIVLSNQEVLSGQVAMHINHDLVLFKSRENVSVFPAHKIHGIFFYDPNVNINRKFIALAQSRQNFKSYRLYEVVLRGELMVLRKEKMYSNSQHNDFAYYIQFKDKLHSLRQFRNKIFPHLQTCDELSSFMKSEHLNPNLAKDAILLIKFYNALSIGTSFAKTESAPSGKGL